MNRQKKLVNKELDRIRDKSRRKAATEKFATKVLISTLIVLGLLSILISIIR